MSSVKTNALQGFEHLTHRNKQRVVTIMKLRDHLNHRIGESALDLTYGCQEEAALTWALEYIDKAGAVINDAADLLEEVVDEHKDPLNEGYNECDTSPCAWCNDVKGTLRRLARFE